jgi:hypothetical protein
MATALGGGGMLDEAACLPRQLGIKMGNASIRKKEPQAEMTRRGFPRIRLIVGCDRFEYSIFAP